MSRDNENFFFPFSDSEDEPEGLEKNNSSKNSVFEDIFDAAFSNSLTRKLADKTLAEALLNRIKALLMTRGFKYEDISSLRELELFLSQFNRLNKGCEKIALVLSLQDFLIRTAEHFDNLPCAYDLLGYEHEEDSVEEKGLVRQEIDFIICTRLPEICFIQRDNSSEILLQMGTYFAYFKMGALGASVDQALNLLGEKMGREDLFAKTVPLIIYPDNLVRAQGTRVFKSLERFKPQACNDRAVLGFKNITPTRLESESRKARAEQTLLLGSLEIQSRTSFSQDDFLMQLGMQMVLQLHVVESQETQATILLVRNTDSRILEDLFAIRPEPKAWEDFHNFFENLDPQALGDFLEKLDNKSLNYTLINERIIPREEKSNLFYASGIEDQGPSVLQEYDRLKFSPEYLFSKSQVELFKHNLSQMKAIARAFKESALVEPRSILQLFKAFDPDSARNFLISSLFSERGEEFIRNLPNTVLSKQELSDCLRLLSNSLTEEELRQLLSGGNTQGPSLFQPHPDKFTASPKIVKQHGNSTPPPSLGE